MKAYQIKVTIKGSKPPVWRRMIIPSGITFQQFSQMINTAMEWGGYHLYSFDFAKLGTYFQEKTDDWDMMPFGNTETLDAVEYQIDSYIEIQKSFTYTYDFGDDWKHMITVEDVIEDYDQACACVIKFKGNSFPEDCGGVWGYYELMETLNDSDDPEYENASEWYENMCPEEYDMDVINEMLHDLGMGETVNLPEDVNVLLVVDMQNDFIDGALGTKEAQAIVPKVSKKIEEFDGIVLFTKDTHNEKYMETQEGKNLPVPHCVRGTKGWEIHPAIAKWVESEEIVIEKAGFGSPDLAALLGMMNQNVNIKSITLVGVCTDICVISNAMLLKSFMSEIPIIVDASCCAGVTQESHRNALEVMKVCQIKIENQ